MSIFRRATPAPFSAMRPARADTDQRLRSLLQKAVRRGNEDLVRRVTSRLLEKGPRERAWLRQRTRVIAFEESWPLGGSLGLTREPQSKVDALIRIARSVKMKDAAGLGSLAYAFYRDDESVISGAAEADRPVRLVAEALQRPKEFWEWAHRTAPIGSQSKFVEAAYRSRAIGWPWDQAFVLAAAYLAIEQAPPPVALAPPASEIPCPLWVALDRHTPDGKRALRSAATLLGLPRAQLEWCSFYFESAVTNAEASSDWWAREQHWRLHKVGLAPDRARAVWAEARFALEKQLKPATDALAESLYPIDTIDQLALFQGPSDVPG